jgi:thiol-disulfide isomerase/thioredoxin
LKRNLQLFFVLILSSCATTIALCTDTQPGGFVIEGKIINSEGVGFTESKIYLVEMDAWFLPKIILDSISLNSDLSFSKRIMLTSPFILKYEDFRTLIFPHQKDTLKFNLDYAAKKMVNNNQGDIYNYWYYYKATYQYNAGFDSLHYAMIKNEFSTYLKLLNDAFTRRNNEVDSVCAKLNCPMSFISYLKLSMLFEYETKKYDFLVKHHYIQTEGLESRYFLADSIFYESFPYYLFNDDYIYSSHYDYFIEYYIDDYYYRNRELYPEKMQNLSSSTFKFEYAKRTLSGKTRDLGISIVIKSLIDFSSEPEDFIEAEKLIEEFAEFNLDSKYLNFLKTYVLDKNPFKNKVEFCLPNELDKNICLSDFYGNNVVLFLTGTWCGPCKKEIPFFEQMIQANTDENLTFIYISLENNNEKKWKESIVQKKLHGVNLYAEGQMKCAELKELNINYVPRFILIDKNGFLVDGNANAPSDGLDEQINMLFNN